MGLVFFCSNGRAESPSLIVDSRKLGMFFQSSTSQSSVTISGKVLDENGKPVPNASVSLNTLRTIPSVRLNTISAQDGSYRFTGVAKGEVRVCAQLKDSIYVNPCFWSPMIGQGATPDGSTTINIRLERGALLKVQLIDTESHLTASQALPLRMGVTNKAGQFYPMPISSRSKTTTTYQLLIPFEQDLRLTMHGSPVSISDNNASPAGAPAKSTSPQASNGFSSTFRHGSNDGPEKVMTFIISSPSDGQTKTGAK